MVGESAHVTSWALENRPLWPVHPDATGEDWKAMPGHGDDVTHAASDNKTNNAACFHGPGEHFVPAIVDAIAGADDRHVAMSCHLLANMDRRIVAAGALQRVSRCGDICTRPNARNARGGLVPVAVFFYKVKTDRDRPKGDVPGTMIHRKVPLPLVSTRLGLEKYSTGSCSPGQSETDRIEAPLFNLCAAPYQIDRTND